jgi:hypothetical protein
VSQAGLPAARPFLLGRADRFRPPAPPAIGSAAYRADFEEVKAVGGDPSAVRTPAQTDVARFWAQTSLGGYTGVLRAILQDSPRRSLLWKSDLVAAFHAITLDAQTAVYEAKYHYLRWRPITAIRKADTDGDPATIADPAWTPLITTPQHPEFPSGHTGYAGAAERVLRTLVGPRPPRPFSLTSPNAPGVTFSYGSDAWTKLTEENVDARVWSGIHWRSTDETGAQLGRRVADYDLRRIGLRTAGGSGRPPTG